jgi:hypothetical protein
MYQFTFLVKELEVVHLKKTTERNLTAILKRIFHWLQPPCMQSPQYKFELNMWFVYKLEPGLGKII